MFFSAIKVLARSIRDYFKDDGVTHSAALSYFIIVSIIPLGLFMLAIFGKVLGDNAQFRTFLTAKLVGLFPSVTSGITKELGKLISFKHLARTSILVYAFMSYQLYSALNDAVAAVFRVEERRGFWKALVLPLVTISVVIVLVGVSFALTTMLPVMDYLRENFPTMVHLGRATSVLVGYVVPFIIVLFTVLTLYMALPKKSVPLGNAMRGALFTTVMLEVAKYGFAWYVSNLTTLGTLYGSLSAFVIFLVWVFYSAALFIIGAQIVKNLDKAPKT